MSRKSRFLRVPEFHPPELRGILLSLCSTRPKIERDLLSGELEWFPSRSETWDAKVSLSVFLNYLGVHSTPPRGEVVVFTATPGVFFKLQMRMAQEYEERKEKNAG